MTRLLAIGLISLCLTACGTPPPEPVAVRTRIVADVPPADMVAACDTTDRPWYLNIELLNAWVSRGEQRDECALRMDAVRRHREEALERARLANEAEGLE